jgi:cobalt/nickel transport system permease protein
LHHVVVERWSRGSSPLHTRDARSKLGALLVFLIAVSTTSPRAQLAFAGYAALLLAALFAARLPLVSVLTRAALVLPFSATFALITWWAGDPARAISLAEKSFLSGLAVLLTIATTPWNDLVHALGWMGVPRFLLLVIQFVYRYLFVISEQAQHMRQAAISREGTRRARSIRFRAATGAVGVLFARSWERAEGIHRAMLARGFTGHFLSLERPHFHAADIVFFCAAASAAVAVRLAL